MFTYGGTFLYHIEPNQVHLGIVIGLDYSNPTLNPYEEFQRTKLHPEIRKHIEGGQCISYGARALNEGGFYSIPKLTFPGGLLVGCSAGMLNVAKIKGAHNAIKSGILAAESIYKELKLSGEPKRLGKEITSYQKAFNESPIFSELRKSRNVHGGFKKGLLPGLVHSYLVSSIFKGKEPWSIVHKKKDSEMVEPKSEVIENVYPKHDGKLTFDLLENLARSGTNHQHDQPSHLRIKSGLEHVPLKSLNEFGAPEERFCPAKVYEFVDDPENPSEKKLQINAQNCLHCKTCSIKMVEEYIEWTVPEGSGGPN